MSPINRLLMVILLLFIVAIIYALYHSSDLIKSNPFLDKNLLKRGMDKPVIWLYYDTSDVNSRHWFDFGARTSRALNLPFLNLCYETIVNQNKENYRVEVIGGLQGVAELLGGWNKLPPGLRDPIAPVNEAELNYIRSTILAKYGGLWLTPYSISLNGFGNLPKDKIVFFGTDLEETYSGSNGTTVPGFRAIWSPYPEHPLFKEWSEITYARVAQKRGGDQIRRDANWDYIELTNKYVANGIIVDPAVEGMRKKNGKRIQLEDLLATGTEGNLPFDLSSYTVYVPFPWTELRDREFFGWFLRMNEKQILESDIAVKYLIQSGLS